MGDFEHSEQLPPEPDFAGDAKAADARGSISDAPATSASASHDAATCWWCQNPQSATELAHKREMESKAA